MEMTDLKRLLAAKTCHGPGDSQGRRIYANEPFALTERSERAGH